MRTLLLFGGTVMDNQLMQFDIVGLHGVRDYSILFEDNKVIIVGENGSGKTTVFKIMYHTLSCDWDSLRTFDFECVSLEMTRLFRLAQIYYKVSMQLMT